MTRELTTVTDARAMRALAHPLRLTLLGLLRRERTLTATEAAARVGESSASCSFHLRQLEKYGFFEDAGGGSGRERPWRATGEATSWSDATDDATTAVAAQALNEAVASTYGDRIARLLARRPALPREWRDASWFGDHEVFLTEAELREVSRDLAAILARHGDRVGDPSLRPADARRVSLLAFALPHAEP